MSTLTIGYDASSTLAPRSGIGRSALQLLRAMVEADDERFQFRVLLNSLRRSPGPEHDFLKTPRVKVLRKRRPGGMLVQAWRQGKGPAVEDLLGPNIDLFHAPASYIPPARSARRVITVHDLSFIDEPPEQLEKLGGAYFRETFPKFLPQCDLIATPSAFVREQVIDRYGISADRVEVVPWGIDRELFRPASEPEVERARHAAITPPDYILAVSDHMPRKRIGLMLDVYARLRELEPGTPKLAVLGWRGRPPQELRERPELHKNVLVLRSVPDEHLAGLYSGAIATFITSGHEGFGFPVLEAQACGSPVVCGRNSALAEIGGDGVAFVEGADVDAWAEALRTLVFDQEAHDAQRAVGLQHAAEFTWAAAGRKMLDLYAR
ncbi:glycosyltransferase family 4 protein [bacterium]|nr:glycosyltransferase family 4 protein [bacterium]